MHASAPPARILPATHQWPLHDVAASRAVEAAALAAHPAGVLMRRAGRGVARWVRALAPHAGRIHVWCGPGGNGGDGLHAAAALQSAHCRVSASFLGDRARLQADALEGLHLAEAAGVEFMGASGPPDDVDVRLDAVFGLGSSRAPAGPFATAIDAFNAGNGVRLAIDLPSGLDADTGMPFSDHCARADATLSLLSLRPGLFTGQGRDFSGEVWLDDLGLESPAAPVATAQLSGPPPGMARRAHATHKGSYGDVLVVGGAPGMHGAARLAAHAALAAGAGRTIVSLLDEGATPGDTTRPEWLWRHAAWRDPREALANETVVCGCGGGQAVLAALAPLLSRCARLVLDADALNAVAADAALRTLLRARGQRGMPTILTPHPLEAARLLASSTADVQRDRLGTARRLSAEFGAVVVLKGSGTVIAAADGRLAVNPTGNASLATGGTGDVLAGWIGGRWAGAGDDPGVAFSVAQDAVWIHGRAAERSHCRAVRALDLVDGMRAVDSAP